MKKLKPHFVYNKKQRNGVFYLLSLILFVQAVYFLVSNNAFKEWEEDEVAVQLIQKIDSLRKIETVTYKLKKFNPNYISDDKGYELGMSIAEIDRLLLYRENNNWINSSIEFQRITKVSDSLLQVLTPLFLFSNKTVLMPKKTKYKRAVVHLKNKNDINNAGTIQLQKVYGIGEKLSARIVKYRKRLGGFVDVNQLDEVYGLKDEALSNLKDRYKVIDTPTIVKLDVNKASFKEVLSIVYLDYETTKRIFQYKNSVDEIAKLEEIKKIPGFPIDKYDRIALYLRAE